MSHHLPAYSVSAALYKVFVRPAIVKSSQRSSNGALFLSRTFVPALQPRQKLSKKQRETTGVLTEEDEERIRKAREKAERKAAGKPKPLLRRGGSRAEQLLKSIQGNLGGPKEGEKDETSKPLVNEEIKAEYISFVDGNGKFHRRVSTAEVLWSLNRAEEKLQQVKPATPGDRSSLPTCRIVNLAEERRKEAEVKSRALAREASEKQAKQLEMTWMIGPADLDMKIAQMRKFLSEGRKLDVTIERKFRRQRPDMTGEELRGLVDKIREGALGVKGAREKQAPEGRLAESLVLFFEGPKGGLKSEAEKQAEDNDVIDLMEPEIAGSAAS